MFVVIIVEHRDSPRSTNSY